MKTTYTGTVKGKKTRITFEGLEPMRKLSRFCTNYKADITTFKPERHDTPFVRT